eukprot:TRINITY_DN12812_c0_g1_i3.p1 TRINITY_DN12812_c0_g1~~TRINITY_DN12812_c0_g1_i3.p1  ORF type:complete len:449 (+),score=38.92 TRINITY_DN12812_c0_g1_i3:33-1349(+)
MWIRDRYQRRVRGGSREENHDQVRVTVLRATAPLSQMPAQPSSSSLRRAPKLRFAVFGLILLPWLLWNVHVWKNSEAGTAPTLARLKEEWTPRQVFTDHRTRTSVLQSTKSSPPRHSRQPSNHPTRRPKKPSKTDSPGCKPQRVAIMISGQLHRFIYRDQHGPFFAYETIPSQHCGRVIDVYITLHNGTVVAPWDGHVTTIPYLSNTTHESIRSWFIARGAQSVRIQSIGDARLQSMVEQIHQIPEVATPKTTSMIEDFSAERWHSNLKMFFLRHLVYRMTLDIEYDVYLYQREDNHFIQPLALNSVLPKLNSPRRKPNIALDLWCGFGAFSDKLYVTNPAGAAVLFDRTMDGFKQKIVSWIEYADLRKSQDKLPDYYFQTEAFLGYRVMANSGIHKLDIHRIDARYVDNRLCIPGMYWKCAPDLKARNTLAVCPEFK